MKKTVFAALVTAFAIAGTASAGLAPSSQTLIVPVSADIPKLCDIAAFDDANKTAKFGTYTGAAKSDVWVTNLVSCNFNGEVTASSELAGTITAPETPGASLAYTVERGDQVGSVEANQQHKDSYNFKLAGGQDMLYGNYTGDYTIVYSF